MIVRNEAELLPQFLHAVAGAYDELCVVDTGSDDATCEILAAAGARILHFPWQADFAAARNVGLDAAQGEWVLFLDADEMVPPEFAASVAAAVQDPEVGAAAVAMRHDLAHGHHTLNYLVRMFRAHPSIRFQHAIHEDIVAPTMRRLQATGQRLVQLEGTVLHLGYTPERAKSRNKKERDLTALRQCVDANPQDLYSWYKMLELARFWGDTGLWTDVAYEADANLTAVDPQVVASAWYMGDLLCLLAEGMYAGDTEMILAYLAPWGPQIQPSAAFFLRCAEMHELLGQTADAQAAFAHCIRLRPVTANAQLATVRPLLGLSRLAIARGDTASALELVDLALTENPRDPEALLALTTLTRAYGAGASERVVQAYIESHGDTTELRAALGETALRAGETDRAITELTRATQMTPGGRAAALLDEARGNVAP
jgi:glycosyltransferase involved in cell wall biosynthesis